MQHPEISAMCNKCLTISRLASDWLEEVQPKGILQSRRSRLQTRKAVLHLSEFCDVQQMFCQVQEYWMVGDWLVKTCKCILVILKMERRNGLRNDGID